MKAQLPAKGRITSMPMRGTAALPANTWSHLATTWDGGTLRLYVNGTQVASKAVPGTMTISAGPLAIGGSSALNEFFSGRVDEVRVYNRALTAGELATYLRRQFRVEVEDVQAETQDGQRNYQNLVIDRGGVQVDDIIVRLAPAQMAALGD